MTAFDALIDDIATILGSTSGLDSKEVNHNELIACMTKYTSNEPDWSKFAFPDPHKNYTRNLVNDTNGKSNILVVVWNPSKGSPIHDHANAHCIMKILKGRLTETMYSSPEEEDDVPQPVKTTRYSENEVTYISDKIGLHKIENVSTTTVAISLHLYTPPHAADYGFNIYNEGNGKKVHIRTAPLHSEYGEICKSNILAKMKDGRRK